jgi:hypothetical protein
MSWAQPLLPSLLVQQRLALLLLWNGGPYRLRA